MSKTMQFNTEQEAFAWMYNELTLGVPPTIP